MLEAPEVEDVEGREVWGVHSGFFAKVLSDCLEMVYGGKTLPCVSWQTAPFFRVSLSRVSLPLVSLSGDIEIARNRVSLSGDIEIARKLVCGGELHTLMWQ